MKFVFCFCVLLSGAMRQGHAAAKVEAYVGEPFGVGRVTIDVLRGEPVLPLSDERFSVEEASGRVVYPVLKQEPVRRILRGLLDIDTPRKVTFYYLFQGDQPFELSAYTPYEQGIRVSPRRNAVQHKQLLDEWWQQYTKYYETLLKDRAYPPVAENFLVATLSRRLNLPIPQPKQGLLGLGFVGNKNEPMDSLNALVIDEAHRLKIDRMLLHGPGNAPFDLEALPQPIEWPKAEFPDGGKLEEVSVERLSRYVPAECFYLRFGNFTNYLWFRDLNKKWQGDLANMVFLRGIKRSAGERIQQQLSLRESALAKIMGPQVIADAAIIGLDHQIAQGAGIGILFQAKNNFLLSADLMKQRREALTKFADAEETTISINEQPVSLIATPDGQIRSYYAQQEEFHLVTTSRTLAERFLQAGQGDRSLATSPSFRQAREEFPISRSDTMFAFVSTAYWENICSPQYFIENQRRIRSDREPLLLELSRLVAVCEGQIAHSTEELVAAGILPQHFGMRADGSKIQAVDTGFEDSLRGSRGYFLPIADMSVDQVSTEEAASFRLFAEKLQRKIGRLPPVAVAVSRTPAQDGKAETIALELYAQGSLRQSLGKMATWLGQPADQNLQPVAGDLLSVEAVVNLPSLLAEGEDGEDQHIFAALRDYRAPLVVRQGQVQPNENPAELVRGYLGAWPPKAGLLTFLTGGQVAQGAEPQRIEPPLVGEMWQSQQDDFLLLSFKPDVIQQVLPQLAVQQADHPAQLWLRLEDLTGTQMAENVNALGYMRMRDSSAAGNRMMNSLANQLHVPRDQCRALAERLVDGEFVCALGGMYQLYAPRRGLEVWVSSALPEQNRFLLSAIPEGFQLPLLTWFRGMQGDLRLDETALRIHLQLKMTQAALP